MDIRFMCNNCGYEWDENIDIGADTYNEVYPESCPECESSSIEVKLGENNPEDDEE